MIDVRVSDQNSIERTRIKRRGLPVALAQFFQSLKQSAVDKHASAVAWIRYFDPVTVPTPPQNSILAN